MLINFTVDPDIFLRDYNLDERNRHLSLIELWENYGQLNIPAENELDSRFYKAYQKAHQSIQLLWREPLKRFRKRCCKIEFDNALLSDNTPSSNPTFPDIFLISLDHTRGFCWGLDDDVFSKTTEGKLEICRFGHERRANSFSNTIELSKKPIDTSYTPNNVWNERVKGLAKDSRVIVVLDRYAVKGFLESRQMGSSGIERLLLKLNDLPSPTKRIVNIYSALSLPQRGSLVSYFEEAYSQLNTFCEGLNESIKEVNLNLVDDRDFGAITHYRYLRFDEQHILLLDTGVEPLSGDSIKRTCTSTLATWNADSSECYRNDEQLVRNIITFKKRITLGDVY